jgi:hypothetical protein
MAGMHRFNYRAGGRSARNGEVSINHADLRVPHWFVASLSLPLPLIAIRRWRKRRRVAREGLCKVYGYDLRASVERCPECGTGFGMPEGTGRVS